jgi:hypothetical protein
MSGNLAMINTMSAVTWNTNVAIPYTADRFYLHNGTLKRVTPPYESFRDYTRAFFDVNLWRQTQVTIKKWDEYYDSWIMKASILDRSAFIRLIRRAYAQRQQRAHRARIFTREGINLGSSEVQVAQGIIHEFAIDARRHNVIPIVFIANLLGDSNYLFRALEPALAKDRVAYLSSDTVASPDDPRKYLSDTHFTAAVDDEMARALVHVMSDAENDYQSDSIDNRHGVGQ